MWGKVAQGLVRTHCVIGKLPKAELLVQGSDLQGKVFDLIELLGMGTLWPIIVTPFPQSQRASRRPFGFSGTLSRT